MNKNIYVQTYGWQMGAVLQTADGSQGIELNAPLSEGEGVISVLQAVGKECRRYWRKPEREAQRCDTAG